jgi:hypothetical protein
MIVGDEIFVDPKSVCEGFGLTWASQHNKLVSAAEEDSWAVMSKIIMTGRHGKVYAQSVITLETFLVWLTTISISRVDEQPSERLRLYQ